MKLKTLVTITMRLTLSQRLYVMATQSQSSSSSSETNNRVLTARVSDNDINQKTVIKETQDMSATEPIRAKAKVSDREQIKPQIKPRTRPSIESNKLSAKAPIKTSVEPLEPISMECESTNNDSNESIGREDRFDDDFDDDFEQIVSQMHFPIVATTSCAQTSESNRVKDSTDPKDSDKDCASVETDDGFESDDDFDNIMSQIPNEELMNPLNGSLSEEIASVHNQSSRSLSSSGFLTLSQIIELNHHYCHHHLLGQTNPQHRHHLRLRPAGNWWSQSVLVHRFDHQSYNSNYMMTSVGQLMLSKSDSTGRSTGSSFDSTFCSQSGPTTV